MSDERNSGFLTFLSGAVIGAALGILFAPQSGRDTRRRIRDVSEKAGDEIKEKYDLISVETRKGIDTIKSAANDAVEQIKNFTAKFNQAEEVKPPAKKTAAKKK